MCDSPTLQCSVCLMYFNVNLSWGSHKGDILCGKCIKIPSSNQQFSKFNNFKNFQTSYPNNPPNRLQCYICNNNFMHSSHFVSALGCLTCHQCIKNFRIFEKFNYIDLQCSRASNCMNHSKLNDFKVLQFLKICKTKYLSKFKASSSSVNSRDSKYILNEHSFVDNLNNAKATTSVRDKLNADKVTDNLRAKTNILNDFNINVHNVLNVKTKNDNQSSCASKGAGSKYNMYPHMEMHDEGSTLKMDVTLPGHASEASSLNTKCEYDSVHGHSNCSEIFYCDFCKKCYNSQLGFIAFSNKIKCLTCTNSHRHPYLGTIQCDYCSLNFNVLNTFQSISGFLKCFKCILYNNYNLCRDNQGNTVMAHKTNDTIVKPQCCCQNPACSINDPTRVALTQCSCPYPVCTYELNTVAKEFKTGFIPHGPLQMFQGTYNVLQQFEFLQVNKELKQQAPNCIQSRIVVPTKFNLPLWKHLLSNYWDHQIVGFLHCGFPLDIKQGANIKSGPIENHASATQYSSHVDKYIQTEKSHGSIVGPYTAPPLLELHSSPMMTRPKPGSENRRVIVDLSWPHSASVNDAVQIDSYMGTPFSLRFPTVDDIAERIVALRGNCLLYKVDLKRAFRQLKLDPRDIGNTGLFHNQQHYLDVSVPFGYRHGSMACQRFTDAIRYVMHKHGFTVFNYIDDLIGCEEPGNANPSYQFLLTLLHALGISISTEKLCPPQSEVPCLGIDINTQKGTMCIPSAKLATIYQQCLQWLDKTTATKPQLQSLLGTLLYIHKCVRPARIFVNRILFTLRTAPAKGRIKLSPDFHKDIKWFTKFVFAFNGKTIFDKTRVSPKLPLYLDACLSGMGGCLGSQVYHCKLPQYITRDKALFIVHLEMLNILVALKLWANQLACKSITIFCDNLAVVTVCQTGRTHDTFLATLARNIWFIMATCDINVEFLHIAGKRNVAADILSRWHLPTTPKHKLLEIIPNPVWCNVISQHCMVDHTI